MFFVSLGAIMLAEQAAARVAPNAMRRAWASLPAPLTATLLTLLSCIPCDPLYMSSWRDSGMLRSLGDIVPFVRCDSLM